MNESALCEIRHAAADLYFIFYFRFLFFRKLLKSHLNSHLQQLKNAEYLENLMKNEKINFYLIYLFPTLSGSPMYERRSPPSMNGSRIHGVPVQPVNDERAER